MPGPLIYNSWDTQNDAAVATLARSLLSASAPLAYSNVTGQFTITQADSTHNGFLTSADWVVFNSKQPALGFTAVPNTRNINTTAPLAGGGDLSADRTLSITQSGVASNGYLSSGDWNLFAGKQGAITWQNVTAGSSKITLGGTPAGSVFSAFSVDVNEANLTLSNMGGILGIAHGGTNNSAAYTAGSVIFSNGTSLTQDNAKFFWDDTNFALCIGTVTQAAALTVLGATAQNAALFTAGNGTPGVNSPGGNWAATTGAGAAAATGNAGSGGAFNFNTGAGAAAVSAGTGGTGGDFNVTLANGGSGVGAGKAAGRGGNTTFTCGNAGASTNAVTTTGGSFIVTSGVGSVNGTATAPSGPGGLFSFTAGYGGNNSGSGAAGTGGSGAFRAGTGGINSATGAGGNGGTFAFYSGPGGACTAAGARPGAGGDLQFVAGLSPANGLGNTGGNIIFTAGAGSINSNGGNVTMDTGAGAGSGVNGFILLGVTRGKVGVGVATPSALLHVAAGTATAGTAPIKLTAGTLLGAVENGALEYDGTNLWFTTGGVRHLIV